MTESTTKTQLFLARLAIALVLAFAVVGLLTHGFSAEVRQRVWQDLVDRPSGPMAFRFILQPVMAAIAAFLDGRRDAKLGGTPYLWSLISSSNTRGDRLREGFVATARVILLGLGMDVVYQAMVLHTFHPGEAALVAILLAFLPYVLLRGPFARIAGWRGNDSDAKEK